MTSTIMRDDIIKWLEETADCRRVTEVVDLTKDDAMDKRRYLCDVGPDKKHLIVFDHHFEPACDILIYDAVIGALGVVHFLNNPEEDDVRRHVEQAAYLRHIALTNADTGRQPLTVELVLVVDEGSLSTVGAVLRQVTVDNDFIHGIGVNVLSATKNHTVDRAFCWLMPNVRKWLDQKDKFPDVTPVFTGVELTDWRLPGKRVLTLEEKDKAAVHLVLGANGSGKSSLVEAIEYLATRKIERLESVVPIEDGRMDMGKLQEIIAHQPRNGGVGKEASARFIGRSSQSGASLLHHVGAFRLDQGVMDKLTCADDAERADYFTGLFFPEYSEIREDYRKGLENLAIAEENLPKWVEKPEAEMPLNLSRDVILRRCLYIPENSRAVLAPLLPQLAALLAGAPQQFGSADEAAKWLSALDDALQGFPEREKTTTSQIDRALKALADPDLVRWSPESSKGAKATADELNAWLRADALVKMTRQQSQIIRTLLQARQAVDPVDLGALGAIQGLNEESVAALDEQKQKAEEQEKSLRDRVNALGADQQEASGGAAKAPPLTQSFLADLDAVTDYLFDNKESNGRKLGQVVREAVTKGAAQPIGGEIIGADGWSMRLTARLKNLQDAFVAISRFADADRTLPGEVWRRIRVWDEGNKAKRQAATALNESLMDAVFRNETLFKAVDELIAVFTPARWAYPSIGVHRETDLHSKDKIFIRFANENNGQFRLNTAELNLFTVALFLLCAPIVKNDLRLLVLDDPLQNMDELTVTTMARGVSRLMRFYPKGWLLLMLFHGQDDFERMRQEISSACYRLPWLSPGYNNDEEIDKIDGEINISEMQMLYPIVY